MTEHLPECPMSTKDAICCSLACICDALRACEDRVLNAAREAVRNECSHDTDSAWCVFVAAIDALREAER